MPDCGPHDICRQKALRRRARGRRRLLNLYSPQAVLPLLQKEFGTTEAGIALIMFASILAVALTAPFTGAIADVIGRKRVITGAMIALVIPTAMSALAPISKP